MTKTRDEAVELMRSAYDAALYARPFTKTPLQAAYDALVAAGVIQCPQKK
jgi:hypothetical protein